MTRATRGGLPDFAVVDVETTGLCAGGNDRIIEIAVVRCDAIGTVIQEYVSLINPDRDLGPTNIHGITAREARRAPTFHEICGDILDLLRGAVFVAHNAPFDVRFVRAEMERSGCALPPFRSMCTVQLSRKADPLCRERKLGALCQRYGIPLNSQLAHSALEDARATKALLFRFIDDIYAQTDRAGDMFETMGTVASIDSWPHRASLKDPLTRVHADRLRVEDESYLGSLVRRLPPTGNASAELAQYSLLLDRVMEDRRITRDEAEALQSLALEIGLSQDVVRQAHKEYVEDLIGVALADGYISRSERQDLEEVCSLLCVNEEELERSIQDVQDAPFADASPAKSTEVVGGKSVCFTGVLRCRVEGQELGRDQAERIAVQHGMIVKSGVSKKLDILVTSDPDSMSVKAKKARAIGVRVVAEPVFWAMLGQQID